MKQEEQHQLDQLMEDQDVLHQIFDSFRIVDARDQRVCNFSGDAPVPTAVHCYACWSRRQPCLNCISKKAALSRTPVTKLEFLDGEVYLVIACPLQEEQGGLVLELIKNVTTSLYVKAEQQRSFRQLHEMVEQFNEFAVRDQFTGLYNKSYVNTALPAAVTRAKANGTPLAVAMIDLDRFKQVNDTYGHQAGDDVLVHLSKILKEIKADLTEAHFWAARYGGDEILLVFENISSQQAADYCETLKSQFAAKRFHAAGQLFSVSFSIGTAVFGPGTQSAEALLNQADALMYQDKNTNRKEEP